MNRKYKLFFQKCGEIMKIQIKVGSVTNAQRGAKLLRLYSIKTTVARLEHPDSYDGCGFVLNIDENEYKKAVSLLNQNGIRILGTDNI